MSTSKSYILLILIKKKLILLCRGNLCILQLSIIASLHNFYFNFCLYLLAKRLCYIVNVCNCPIRLRVWSRKSQPRLPNGYTPSCAIYCYTANKFDFPDKILFPSKLDVGNKHNFLWSQYLHQIKLHIYNN